MANEPVLIADGKTKALYDLGNGNYQLFFKDDMTGADGVFDPGANAVGLTMEGAGAAGLAMSAYCFRLLRDRDCATHFVDADVEARTMIIKPATVFGKGLEVVCRFKALGSFVRRYGLVVESGTPLNAVVEMTLKDDERGDPLINQESLEALGILKPGEYEDLSALTKRICRILKDALAEKGLELCDIKLEFGRDKEGNVMLIDELSAGNMRVLDNGKSVGPLELTRRVLGK